MLQPRLLQNFSGFSARIVVADRRPVEMLETSLRRLGLAVSYLPLADGRVLPIAEPLQAERDVLFVDGDLEAPLAGLVAAGEALPAVPVIGLVGVEAPSRLKALMQLGATAFLRKPVHGAAVYSALFVGMNGFLHRRHLEASLDGHEQRRRGRRFVIKAVVMLMRERGIDDDAAFAVLRRESMRLRQSLEDYCEALVRLSAARSEGLQTKDVPSTCAGQRKSGPG
jgi:AmiR/NasT family two-component response regulator